MFKNNKSGSKCKTNNSMISIMFKKWKFSEKSIILTGLTLIISLVMILSVMSSAQVQATYVSGSWLNRYVLDLEAGGSYDSFSSYELEIEDQIGSADLYLNPVFTYNYEQYEGEAKLAGGYLDLYFDRFDFRIGKQKLTWGKGDGLVVTNLVNPRDLKEYPAVEFEDQFKAINALKANYYFGADTLEMVWIPEFEPVEVDKELFYSSIAGNMGLKNPQIDSSRKDIDTSFENSELALKYSSLGSNLDYELMAGYLWDDQPTMHLEQVDPTTRKIVPRHHRLTMVGGSFSTARGPYVFRGEAAYTGGKYYNSKDFSQYPDGTVEKDQAKWLLGIDYTLGEYLLSFQVLEEVILAYEDTIQQDEFVHDLTFLVQRQFLRDTLDTELTFYYDPDGEELIAKPRVSYDYSDKVNLELGANYALEGGIRKDVLYFQTEYLF